MIFHTAELSIADVKRHWKKHKRWTWVEWADEWKRTGNPLDWCVAMSLMEGDSIWD